MRSVAPEKHQELEANSSANHPEILESKLKLFGRGLVRLAEGLGLIIQIPICAHRPSLLPP
jgi:hypothetical protein